MPLGTEADPGGRGALGADGAGGGTAWGATAGRVPLVSDGMPGRVPLGTDAEPGGAAAAATAGLVLTGETPAAGVVALASPGTNTSTEKVNERCSPGSNAPTLTTWRATSSPLSFLIETRTEYSQG